jgi:adenylate kinase
MILVLLGPPGVGKGTQAGRIALHYEVPTISTGAMFRDAVTRGTELGRIIQRYRIEKGEYVPDDVVISAVKLRTTEPDCASGFLLDGFPRTIPQADALEALLKEQGRTVTGALELKAPIPDIVGRFSGRLVCPVDGSSYHLVTQPPLQAGLCDICHTQLVRRADDDPEVVQRRLEVYMEKTTPLMEYYRQRGMLTTVDAMDDPETVFGRILEAIGRMKATSAPQAGSL